VERGRLLLLLLLLQLLPICSVLTDCSTTAELSVNFTLMSRYIQSLDKKYTEKICLFIRVTRISPLCCFFHFLIRRHSYYSFNSDSFAQCCGAGAEEPKLNCLPKPELEPKLGIAAPAPFYLQQT
jgi:hypothetical protein